MADRPRVVIVTGLSGSGRSTAIHVLEDLGYYCIDNLPVVLMPRFLQLRAELTREYGEHATQEGMSVFLVSFGYKFGVPTDADMVLDVRFLPNPFFVEELNGLSGLDQAVVRYLMDRPETRQFLEHGQT